VVSSVKARQMTSANVYIKMSNYSIIRKKFCIWFLEIIYFKYNEQTILSVLANGMTWIDFDDSDLNQLALKITLLLK
jgi:hypothetical protein